MFRSVLVGFACLTVHVASWGWSGDSNSVYERTTTEAAKPSNLGCFLCTQLLSVTKHRVGLSQNQLRSVLYDKCRVLPVVFKDQCFNFVETSLPEIYFSLNYDFSTKDICLRLNLCDDANPFAVGGPPPEEEEEHLVPTESGPAPLSSPPPSPATSTEQPQPVLKNRSRDRIGHKNIVEEKEERELRTDEKRLTCAFCERMLENAKNYAVTSKADITAFANSACANLAKGQLSDQCYQLADKKIAELAKFVDQQVVEALWCAELNQC